MRIGMSLPQGGGDGSRDSIALAARGAEAIGLDSLWVLDRLLRPTRPISTVPGQPAKPLSKFYANVFDPIETLTFAAALTERVTLGTSVIIAPLHPPVVLAKRLATLDQLSGGRVIAGLGQGWMPQEFAAAGASLAHRGKGMTEYVAALRAVWGPDPVCFDSRIYQIPEAEIGPKPVQPGGIPVIIGCFAPAAIARAGTYADGFNPIATTLDALHRDIDTFRDAALAAGRDPAQLPIILRANAEHSETPLPEDGRPLFHGTVTQWVDDIARVAELGVEHVFFSMSGPVDDQLALMEQVVGRADSAAR